MTTSQIILLLTKRESDTRKLRDRALVRGHWHLAIAHEAEIEVLAKVRNEIADAVEKETVQGLNEGRTV